MNMNSGLKICLYGEEDRDLKWLSSFHEMIFENYDEPNPIELMSYVSANSDDNIVLLLQPDVFYYATMLRTTYDSKHVYLSTGTLGIMWERLRDSDKEFRVLSDTKTSVGSFIQYILA